MKKRNVYLAVISLMMLRTITSGAAERTLRNEIVIRSTAEKAWRAMATGRSQGVAQRCCRVVQKRQGETFAQ